MQKISGMGRLTGPENIGPERLLSGILAAEPVLSPSRITLEDNEKIRQLPNRENAFAAAGGGARRILNYGSSRAPLLFFLHRLVQSCHCGILHVLGDDLVE